MSRCIWELPKKKVRKHRHFTLLGVIGLEILKVLTVNEQEGGNVSQDIVVLHRWGNYKIINFGFIN